MWLHARVLILIAALGAVAAAAQMEPAPALAIKGPTKYKAYQLVRLEAVGVPPKAATLWRVSPEAGVEKADTPKGRLQFTAPPGRYTVELLALALVEGDLVAHTAQVVVEIDAPPSPALPPGPGPGPGPLPPGKSAGARALGRLQFGSYGCTATIVGPRRADGKWDVLTASHCIDQRASAGTIVLQDGRRSGVRVVRRDPTPDLCWLVTDAADLGEVPAAILADQVPSDGTRLYHQGYGRDRPGNREEGYVYGGVNSQGRLQMIISFSSGDSGGGIFRADDDRLVSVVCCTSATERKVLAFGGSSVIAARMRPSLSLDELADQIAD